ncbi:unnamed protein product [Ectocarpus sp. 6 AP-2014]
MFLQSTRATTRHIGPGRCCQEDGCTRRPRFGIAGIHKADFCSRHAESDMVDFVKQRCGHPDCTNGASFCRAGSKREFCSQHARKGMINLAQRCCGHPGCTKIPSIGAASSKKREFCCQHAKQGMVDLVRNRGGRPGCTKSPSFGEAGSKKAELCHLGTPTQV